MKLHLNKMLLMMVTVKQLYLKFCLFLSIQVFFYKLIVLPIFKRRINYKKDVIIFLFLLLLLIVIEIDLNMNSAVMVLKYLLKTLKAKRRGIRKLVSPYLFIYLFIYYLLFIIYLLHECDALKWYVSLILLNAYRIQVIICDFLSPGEMRRIRLDGNRICCSAPLIYRGLTDLKRIVLIINLKYFALYVYKGIAQLTVYLESTTKILKI
uniref:Uncharacterized protein n=1 Tax=Heterorhabditis bacteriophora TaxID=37862 RepID=A0A1I7WGX0_HETBA